jgi:hypothetical protein
LKPAAATVRQYGEQFRRPVRRKQNRRQAAAAAGTQPSGRARSRGGGCSVRC